MDCIPPNHEAKQIPPPLSDLWAGLYSATEIRKVPTVTGLGHDSFLMLPYVVHLDIIITRFTARQESFKGLNCSDTAGERTEEATLDGQGQSVSVVTEKLPSVFPPHLQSPRATVEPTAWRWHGLGDRLGIGWGPLRDADVQ